MNKKKVLSWSRSQKSGYAKRRGVSLNQYGMPTRGSISYSPSCVSDGSYEYDVEYWRKEYEFLYGGSK